MMTEYQKAWAQARDQLAGALEKEGFPAALADLLSGQLKSPKAIGRMAAYVRNAHPRSVEMLADEMLAICDEIQAWKDKKSSQQAQAYYNGLLFNGAIGQGEKGD